MINLEMWPANSINQFSCHEIIVAFAFWLVKFSTSSNDIVHFLLYCFSAMCRCACKSKIWHQNKRFPIQNGKNKDGKSENETKNKTKNYQHMINKCNVIRVLKYESHKQIPIPSACMLTRWLCVNCILLATEHHSSVKEYGHNFIVQIYKNGKEKKI